LTVLPITRLFERHRRWYEPGTLERFRAWFERSGYGAMLDNAWLHAVDGGRAAIPGGRIAAEACSGLKFDNPSETSWTVSAAVDLTRNAGTVEELFRNFTLCIAHTHPPGDYREYPAYYTKVHAGPRFLLFDGAGSCLLLGAMIQALAARILNEKIDLHYSVATGRRLTHVYASWKNRFFVDPDQKTWLPLDQVDDAAVYGYIFQQLGVSANALYGELVQAERDSLFSGMSRAYFDFYEPSALQYMSEPRQSTDDLCAMFKQARTDSLEACSIDNSDFPWKDEMRRYANQYGIPRPWFLVRAEEPVNFAIPAHGRLSIGLGMDEMPAEAELLCSIYLGRVPLCLNTPLAGGRAQLDLPEVPWLLAFAPDAASVAVNGQGFTPRLSRDGKFRILGTGDLEPVLGMAEGRDRFVLDIAAPGGAVKAILPFNGFAAASGLMDFQAETSAGRSIEGRRAA
jgi:hypothetical protein